MTRDRCFTHRNIHLKMVLQITLLDLEEQKHVETNSSYYTLDIFEASIFQAAQRYFVGNWPYGLTSVNSVILAQRYLVVKHIYIYIQNSIYITYIYIHIESYRYEYIFQDLYRVKIDWCNSSQKVSLFKADVGGPYKLIHGNTILPRW